MRVQAESTDELVELSAGPCRLWRGQTEGGIPCFLAVRTIAVPDSVDLTEFDRDLLVNPDPPSIDVELAKAGARAVDHDMHVIDARMFR
jgi:hypothetical protein